MSDRLRAVLARFGDDIVEAYETGNAEGYARAIAERTGCRACGYAVILADTEDWPAPLCAGCHERHVAVERSEYARAIADVCTWLRDGHGEFSVGVIANMIEARFGAQKGTGR